MRIKAPKAGLTMHNGNQTANTVDKRTTYLCPIKHTDMKQASRQALGQAGKQASERSHLCTRQGFAETVRHMRGKQRAQKHAHKTRKQGPAKSSHRRKEDAKKAGEAHKHRRHASNMKQTHDKHTNTHKRRASKAPAKKQQAHD